MGMPWHLRRCARSGLVVAGLLWCGVAGAQAPPQEQNRTWCENRGHQVSVAQQITACTTIIEAAADTPQALSAAYNSRGNAHQEIRDYERALADYNEAIRLEPRSAHPHNGRGNVYRAKGDNDRAILDYSEAIRLDPKYGSPYNGRGNAYLDREDYDRAIADYNQAIRLDPANPYPYNGRGNAHRAKGDLDWAIADFTESARLDPHYARPYHGRGIAQRARGDLARAIDDYNEAVKLDPKDVGVRRSRAYANFCFGDYGAAADDFTRVIQQQPDDLYALVWLYLARARPGYQQKAGAELTLSLQNVRRQNWPFPVIELLLGRRTPEAMLAAAAKPDERCEAQFYLGEWHLLHDNSAAAAPALQAAADTCPKDFDESFGARAELRRLAR
jgi:tetratricopeptide (TPR) repeat protein